MPPKPPPPPPNVSTPRRRHRGAASSRSKSAAKELSSPHRPLRPSRKRSTRRHHRRHKPTPSSAFPARRRRRTRPRAMRRPRPGRSFAKAADPDQRLRTSPNGAITGATRSPQAKKHSDELTLVIVIPRRRRATTPTVHRPAPGSRRRSPSWPPLECSKRHSSWHVSGELKWTSLVKEPRVEEASPPIRADAESNGGSSHQPRGGTGASPSPAGGRGRGREREGNAVLAG